MHLDGFRSIDDLEAKFQIKLNDEEIIFAEYSMGDYDGQAWVVFQREGELYEVNASHCSCYGLEGQWDEEKTSVAELEHRISKGEASNSFNSKALIDELLAMSCSLSFDFDSLPTKNEAAALLNLSTQIANGGILTDVEASVASIKNAIADGMRLGLAKKIESVSVPCEFKVRKEISCFGTAADDDIENAVEEAMKPILNSLEGKGWKCSLDFSHGSAKPSVSIELPAIQIVKKPKTHRRSGK